MQRSSLLLFMEEYLWEEEWGKREVNKCSSFSFLLNKWIDKQNASPNLRPDSRQSPRRHCSISGFLSEHCDWIDPWLQCGREAQSDAALLESLSMGLYLMAAVVSCLYTIVLNELDLWPLRLTDHPWINITAYIYDVLICLRAQTKCWLCTAGALWVEGVCGAVHRSALLWRRTVTISWSQCDFGYRSCLINMRWFQQDTSYTSDDHTN